MKKLLLLVFIFFGQIAVSQVDELVKVPGTKCSLIPPDGFVAATTFSGFQNIESGASIMINELPAPYQSLVNGFTAEALKARGMTLINKQTIDLNGTTATMFEVTQSANGIVYLKQMLVFGDSLGTVLVNGIYPESSKALESQIRAAMLSTVFNASQDDNPLEAVTFTVQTNDTDFKLIKYLSGTLLYSTDGKIPTEKPTLIVGNSISKISIQDQKKYSENRLKALPNGELSVIKEINEINIDNLYGYEIIANGKKKDNKLELIYQLMLFNGDSEYYIIVGQAGDEFDKYLETFKKIAKTFKRK